MISGTRLHETVRRDINRINSEYLKAVSVADVDGFLTESWFTIYENLVQKSEVNSLADDRIKQKVLRSIPIKISKSDKDTVKIKYPKDTYRVIRRYAKACREGCDSRNIQIHITQTSDLNESVKDTYWEPSFEWEETLGIQDKDGLIVYHNCKFDINEVVIDYYTKPKPIRCPQLIKTSGYKLGAYIDSNGDQVTTSSDFEIDSTDLWLKVSHYAAAKILMSMGDLQGYESLMKSVELDERILL